MQSVRRLVSSLRTRLAPPLLTVGRFLLGLLRSLSPSAAQHYLALALITAGAWRVFGADLALTLLGVLLLLDVYRPEPPAKP